MIDVLSREGGLILVRKPCGMSSQPGERAGKDLVTALEEQLGAKVWPLHRLDRDTEGIVALALSREDAATWSAVLEGGGSRKRYIAVAAGRMGAASGEIREDVAQRGRTVSALTRWRLLAEFPTEAGDFSLLEIELGTGRMHQIRIHLAGAGHPLLGDDKHGDFKLNKAAAKALGAKKLMLLSRELSLGKGGPSALCPWPSHFTDFISRVSPGATLDELEARHGHA